MDLTYRLLNVFADGTNPFTGTSVCVFDDASGLTADQMQSLAERLNTETVFIQPGGEVADAKLRFFSPKKETGFAGSASLATAHVVRQLLGGSGNVTLSEESVGVVTIAQENGRWVFQARPATIRTIDSSPQILSSLVGLKADALEGDVMVVEAVRSGIVLPVHSVEDLRKTRLDGRMLHSYSMLLGCEPALYVWTEAGENAVESRMFYGPHGGLLEVSATGSGAANLGRWLAAKGISGTREIIQGVAVGRPSKAQLTVTEDGTVFVGGMVNQLARGTFSLPD